MIIETYIAVAGIAALTLAFLGTRVNTRQVPPASKPAAKAA
jgi:hypothetical protein